jgi:hypothetical protein
MFLIVNNSDNVVVDKHETAITDNNGINVGTQIYSSVCDVSAIEVLDVPKDFAPHKYKYINNQYVLNEAYSPIPDVNIKIVELESQLAATNTDLMTLMDYLAGAGVLV